jgi:hypothetical protein
VNADSSTLWPNNVVPYVLEAVFTTADRAIIAAVTMFNCSMAVKHFDMYAKFFKSGGKTIITTFNGKLLYMLQWACFFLIIQENRYIEE